ncbi:hypothetical protein [Paenibacillus terrigena]|uniref:hypothetical protein n=1 Tax=Paenibacillus terrigena TaxID=369333 RepID=UPI0028D5949D|nr:hypothetical protein [Paenibacillus terrigena]
MKLESLKLIKFSRALIILGLVIFVGFVMAFANAYFSESVFYVNDHKYKQANEQGNLVRYTAGSAPFFDVQIDGQNRDVIIHQETYSIHKSIGPFGSNQYRLTYPNGHQYTVNDQSGYLMSFDVKGEIVIWPSFYINGVRQLQKGEEEYYPSELVTAAYSEYHTTQGSSGLFILSLLLFIYGWCGFRYEKFQNFLFFISLRWIWVNNAEPSEFHYFMCKLGGVILMIAAVYFAVQSFWVH